MPITLSKNTLTKAALLLLVFGVAGLSTLAKQGQYQPTPNPAHFPPSVAKMEPGHVPNLLISTSQIAPALQGVRSRLVVKSEELVFLEIGLTISPQHRPPPSSC